MAAILSSTTLQERYVPSVNSGDTATMDVLEGLLEAAESAWALHLRYPGATPTLAQSTYTLRLRRQSATRVVIPVGPVSSVTSVAQSDVADFTGSAVVSSSDYELSQLRNGATIDLINGLTWLKGERVIKVVCVAGYADEAAMPLALADAIYRTAADWYVRREAAHMTSISEQGRSASYSAPADIPAHLRARAASFVCLSAWGVS